MVSPLSCHAAQGVETATHYASGIRTPNDTKRSGSFANGHAGHKASSRDRQVGLCPTCPRCRERGKQIQADSSRPSQCLRRTEGRCSDHVLPWQLITLLPPGAQKLAICDASCLHLLSGTHHRPESG